MVATAAPGTQQPSTVQQQQLQPPDNNSPPTQPDLSWEGDKMFNIYIHDYCLKRGFLKTAKELVVEAEILPDSTPPINAKQGLLFEWWSVFWVLFTAKSSGAGTDDAMLYTNHQVNQAQARQQQQRGPQGPSGPPNQTMNRYASGMQRPPGTLMSNGQQMTNGPPGPGSGQQLQLTNAGPQPFPMPPPGGQPNGGGPPQPQNPGGQNFAHMLGPQQRQIGNPRAINGVPPFQSPTMSNSPQGGPGGGPSGQQQPQPGGPPPMGHLGPSPHMAGRAMMPPSMGNGMNGGGQPPNGPPGFAQMGRSPSRTGTPGHALMPGSGPSPSLAPRQVTQSSVDQHMNDMSFSNEFRNMPPPQFATVMQESGISRDRHPSTLTPDEKKRMLATTRMRRGNMTPGPPNAAAGPSNPMQPPNQLRNQPQRMNKRSSTSPEEEHNALPRNDSSPPERKRVRHSPPGMEGQQQHQSMNGMPFSNGGPHGPPGGMIRGPPLTSAGQNIFPSHGPMGGNPPGMAMGGGGNSQMGTPQMSIAMSPQGGMGVQGGQPQMTQAQLQQRQAHQQHQFGQQQQQQYANNMKLHHGPNNGLITAGSPPAGDGSFNGLGQNPFPGGPPNGNRNKQMNPMIPQSPGMNPGSQPKDKQDHLRGLPPHGLGGGGMMTNGQHPDGSPRGGPPTQQQQQQNGPVGTAPPTPIPGAPSPGSTSLLANPLLHMQQPENMFTDDFPPFSDLEFKNGDELGVFNSASFDHMGGHSSSFDTDFGQWFNESGEVTGSLEMK